ncbi:hypothetical protein [Tepidibacillus sp. LV47]|uniref:hypothetical protein n=1 Tax=Tepidibacillus sp. LV47 TaxID=3398228 RepID=UPI003AAA2199
MSHVILTDGFKYPKGYAYFLIAMQFALWPTREIVVAGEYKDPQTVEIIQAIHAQFLIETVILLHEPMENHLIESIDPFF